jgi:hypothetical protein
MEVPQRAQCDDRANTLILHNLVLTEWRTCVRGRGGATKCRGPRLRNVGPLRYFGVRIPRIGRGSRGIPGVKTGRGSRWFDTTRNRRIRLLTEEPWKDPDIHLPWIRCEDPCPVKRSAGSVSREKKSCYRCQAVVVSRGAGPGRVLTDTLPQRQWPRQRSRSSTLFDRCPRHRRMPSTRPRGQRRSLRRTRRSSRSRLPCSMR